MTQNHTKRASIALRKLAEFDPAYASLSLWCHHRDVADTAIEIAAEVDGETITQRQSFELAPAYTDGGTVWYGQKYETWNLAEQVGVAAHELTHVAFRHVARGKKLRERFGKQYNNRVFNIATDAIINQMLLEAKYTLPRPCVLLTELMKEVFGESITAEEGLQKWDAERLFVRLITEASPQCGGGGGQGEPSEGDGEGGGDQPQETAAEKAEKYAEGKGFGEDMDTSGKLTSKDAQDDSEWQQRLARGMANGKLAGRGIGKLGHLIADLPKSKTPWEVILRRLVSKAVTRVPQQSYMRPTRRWLGMDADAIMRGLPQPAYEPGIVRQNDRPRIAIGADVSGSISDTIVNIFGSEIASIGKKTGAEIHLFVFDTVVLNYVKLDGVDFEAEIKKVEFARGGGTSFVEVMEKIQEVDPSIAVMLTDLHGPFGPTPRGLNVVWASPEANPPKPPFGQLITLDR